MSGTCSIDLTGTVKAVSSRMDHTVSLVQTLTDVESKNLSFQVSRGASAVSLPLGLSTGVTEALLVLIYSPKKLVLRITGADASHPGPVELGIKGFFLLTLTPGEGVASIDVSNPSATEDVTIEYTVAAKAASTDDDPDFYLDE